MYYCIVCLSILGPDYSKCHHHHHLAVSLCGSKGYKFLQVANEATKKLKETQLMLR